MKLVVRRNLPSVDPDFQRMNSLQRAVESWRYGLLCWERWASPDGNLREWLRQNTRVGVWLLVLAVLVMPVVGLILWQLTGWVTMLTTIAGKLIVLSILILVAYVVLRIVFVLLKR